MTIINNIRKQKAKKNLKISKKQNKRSIWIHLKIKKVADVKFRHQKSYGMFFVSLSLPVQNLVDNHFRFYLRQASVVVKLAWFVSVDGAWKIGRAHV